MIHSNFRKLMRQFSRPNGSSSTPDIRNFTDTTGYTGITDVMPREVTYSNYTAPSVISNLDYSSILAGSAKRFFVMVGNTIDEEHDYSLGENVTDGLKLTTTIDKSNGYIITATIINTTSSNITFNEIGLFYHMGTSSSGSWGGGTRNEGSFLLVKKIFDAQQTIPANSSISITFSLFDDVVEA